MPAHPGSAPNGLNGCFVKRVGQCRGGGPASTAEIGDEHAFDAEYRTKTDVGRFGVSMHDAGRAQVAGGSGDVGGGSQRPAHAHRAGSESLS